MEYPIFTSVLPLIIGASMPVSLLSPTEST